jgi:hypothetical protein
MGVSLEICTRLKLLVVIFVQQTKGAKYFVVIK